MIPHTATRDRTPNARALAFRWLALLPGLLLAVLLPACSQQAAPSGTVVEAPQVTSRLITPALWAGADSPGPSGLPAIDAAAGPVTIRGPVTIGHPVSGIPVQAYERTAVIEGGIKRQFLTVTQNGAGLGRVSDIRPGMPERRFTDDVVFPLGLWRQGETRTFEATEITLFGPALRLITLEILDLDLVHDGVPHSLSYRLAIRDEARRVLACERSVYSPGRGLVAFEASSLWQGCTTCPCEA